MNPGDRVIVTMPRSPSREGEYVEDRGSRCRVLLEGELTTRVVLAERVRAVREESGRGMPSIAAQVREESIRRAELWVGREVARGVMLPDGSLVDVPQHLEVTSIDHETRTINVGLRPVPKAPKPLRSERYLAFVRKHPCCAPGCRTPRDGVEAHHFGPHGLSVKCDDFRTVPLCHTCHHVEFHTHGVLRGCNREETERMFTIAMRELLMEWFATERDGDERDVVIVEALIGAIRGAA